MSRAPLLEVKSLNVNYGSAQAIFNLSFSVSEGMSLALLGTNGAGKSTTARAISGLVKSHAATIQFDGVDIGNMKAHHIRRLGLVYLPEGRGIFPGLSVSDNLRMAVRWLSSRSERGEAYERAYKIFPILLERKSQRASTLSGGEQQMLSVAGGLAVAPRLLIADELSLGLAPLAVDAVLDGIERSRQEGTTIILIEQYIHRALDFADECLILQRGTAAWQGESSDAKQEVLERYLGDS